jgi:hypothetical protein
MTHKSILKTLEIACFAVLNVLCGRVSDPYSFDTDPDPAF